MESLHSHKYNLSIAPMLDITTHHFRSFMRILTKHTLLYTEMINADTILNSHNDYLSFFQDQLPLSLQFGGNDPNKLYLSSLKAKEYHYSEYNLNCGCPSSKVTDKSFGAYLMNEPSLVSKCVSEMRKNNFTSIKCRIGLNEYKEDFLTHFIEETNKTANINKYIIHTRIAIMGISTIKNRAIPPLMNEVAFQLKEKYNDIIFVINGGIKTMNEVKENNSKGMGCMIGRAAYDNPWIFKDADSMIFNKHCNVLLNRENVIYQYADYCGKYIEQYKEKIYNGMVNEMIKPLTNLFCGEEKNKQYKQLLYTINEKDPNKITEHLYHVIEEYKKINYEAVNKR